MGSCGWLLTGRGRARALVSRAILPTTGAAFLATSSVIRGDVTSSSTIAAATPSISPPTRPTPISSGTLGEDGDCEIWASEVRVTLTAAGLLGPPGESV